MHLSYDNQMTVQEYNYLRTQVKWGELSRKQAQEVLHHSNLIVCRDSYDIIASIRSFWDGGAIIYVCDIMVSPDYQGRGIGTELVKRMVDYYKQRKEADWSITIVLLSAKGKESFYEQLGFTLRPTERLGPGMTLRI